MNSIAWPIFILIIVLILKVPISKAIASISKLRYKNFEIDFNKELKEIDAKIHVPIEEIYDSKTLIHDKNDIETIANISPNSAITLSWSMIEEEIKEIIMGTSISPDYPPYNSTIKNIALLKENNLIDTSMAEALEELKRMRNVAVHGQRNEEKLSTKGALMYFDTAKKIILFLRKIKRR